MAAEGSGRSGSLRWSVDRQQGLVTVALDGELDLASVDELEQELAALANDGATVTAIDLTGLEFMDSTGLRLLARMQKLHMESGSRFLLGRPGPAVLRVLHVSGLVDFFEYVEGGPPRERLCPVCDEWVGPSGSRCPHCGAAM